MPFEMAKCKLLKERLVVQVFVMLQQPLEEGEREKEEEKAGMCVCVEIAFFYFFICEMLMVVA